MYIKSGNIWMCIGYHFTWNTFQGIIYGMPVSGLNVPDVYKRQAYYEPLSYRLGI